MRPIRSMDDVRTAFAEVWAEVGHGQPIVRVNQLVAPYVRSAGHASTAASATSSDSTNAIKTTTGSVNTSSAVAPAAGQVLTATGTSAATWQAPSLAPTFLLMGG